jgi:hypothetical protein
MKSVASVELDQASHRRIQRAGLAKRCPPYADRPRPTLCGGLYVKGFDREGMFEAIGARRTIAATDKIVMRLSCNGHLLGEVFRTAEKPTLQLFVDGTAPLRAVTVIRNEAVIYHLAPDAGSTYESTFTDMAPVRGENRYYLRVEQVDGNMGWTSPIWVTYARK